MKNLKVLLSTMVCAVVIAASTSVFAVNSLDIDGKIQMPDSTTSTIEATLSEGKGRVSTSLTGDIKYQLIEIQKSSYDEIVHLEYVEEVIRTYLDRNTDDAAQQKWLSTKSAYETKYGVNVSSVTDGNDATSIAVGTKTYSFDAEGLSSVTSDWAHAIGAYGETWKTAESGNVEIDLTEFTGTKYYVIYVNVGDVYDAEVYSVVGTKTAEPENNTNTDNNTNGNTDKGQNGIKNGNGNGVVNNSGSKKDNTTAGKALSKAGTSSVVAMLVAGAAVVAGVSYIRYKNVM